MEQKTERLLLISWFVTAAPLTLLGYGSDGDAWGVAKAATRIWHTGEYVRSRTTGFPLFEIIETPLIHFGEWYLSNLFVLICGVSLLVSLLYLARKGNLSHPFLSVVTFAFLPVIIKNSTSTMDYVPALSLLLWAYAVMLQKRWYLAAILIGVACGFRPTSGLFVLPLCLYLFLEDQNRFLVLRVFSVALFCGMAAYSPALLKYGIPNVYGSINLDFQTRLFAGGYTVLKLFGIVQSFILLFALVGVLRTQKTARTIYPLLLFHFSNIIVWVSLFLFLPDESEYLLPLVPSFIFLLDVVATTKAFALISLVLLSYHFIQIDVLGGESGDRVFHASVGPGLTVDDIQNRLFILSTRDAATHYYAREKTLLMFGAAWIPAANDLWIKDAQYGLNRQINGNLYISGLIRNEEELKNLRAAGFRMFVWRGAKWEYIRTGNPYWKTYVTVVDDLSAFFGSPVGEKGAINQR
jgi:hypothetical protein